MKKLTALLVVFSGLIIVGCVIFEKKASQSSPLGNLQAKKIHGSKVTTARQSLKQSKYIISNPATTLSSFPKECNSQLSDLSGMTAEEYKEFVNNKHSFINFFGETCFEKLSSSKTFKHLVANSNCQLFRKKKKGQGSPCLTLMFLLKAYFIAENTSEKNPEEMTSQELAASFVKMFVGIDQLTKKSFLENLKLINVFQSMHPNDADVLEAYLGYLMIGKQITNENSVDSDIDSAMAGITGGSFKTDRLYVLKDVLQNKKESAKQTLNKLNELYPKEPELAYYYAAYYWKQGNRDMANSYLDKAIALGENCSYCTPALYIETKQRMVTANSKEDKIFSISFGMNFEKL